MTIRIKVNGESHLIDSAAHTPLLYVLRNELGLKGTRFGCGEGTCGTCSVLIDGVPRHSCDLPVEYVGTGQIETVEGLAEGSSMSALQQAFVATQAAQCGFCTSGILMKAQALLDQIPHPTDGEIREALDDHLCRCGSHARVIRAVGKAFSGEEPEPILGVGSPVWAVGYTSEGSGIGNDYVSVRRDGTVSLTIGKVDIGQGISTALGQIAAGALDVRIERIRIFGTDTAISPDEGNTSGSLSIAEGGANVQQASAELRTRLLELAAGRLNAAPGNLQITDGTIAAPDGRSISYWELAGGETQRGASTSTEPSPIVVGRSIPRWDLPGKLRGEPSFVHDLELPSMLHGRVLRPPNGKARLTFLDDSLVKVAQGLVKLVRSGSFLAVVTQEEYQAVEAVNLLREGAEWDSERIAKPLNDPRHLLLEDVQTKIIHNTKGGETAEARTSFAATYTRPFLAHASIGPSCAVALQDGSMLTIWSHTQGVFSLRRAIAGVLELSETAVRVIHMEGSGCYGHNGADDCGLDAALLAREVPGRPVRVQWSRADEFLWEPYGSAMLVQLESSLDTDGNIVKWDTDVWSYVHSDRPSPAGFGFLAAAHLEQPSHSHPRPPLPTASAVRNALPIYTIPNVDVRGHIAPSDHVRTSALRSLGAHCNVFAIESLMDEMAHEIGEDPVSFRLRHLTDARAKDVVEAVADLSGAPIGRTNRTGHGFGLGFARYKNEGGYAAVVAEIEAETDVRVVRVWAVVDAGLIVNPDGAANQIEGGIIQSASWALKESVRFSEGSPDTRGWEEYPILTFSETPTIKIDFIDRRNSTSMGVGEVVQGPTTAAIGNGLRAVLGVPIRDLPFTRDRVTKALLE